MTSCVAVTGASAGTSAETAVASSVSENFNNPGAQGVKISGVLNVTPGTAATVLTLKVKMGAGTTGTSVTPVGGLTVPCTAGVNQWIPFEALDTTTGQTGTVAQRYTVTLQQTSGTGAGTVNYGTLNVSVVYPAQ